MVFLSNSLSPPLLEETTALPGLQCWGSLSTSDDAQGGGRDRHARPPGGWSPGPWQDTGSERQGRSRAVRRGGMKPRVRGHLVSASLQDCNCHLQFTNSKCKSRSSLGADVFFSPCLKKMLKGGQVSDE